jgi:hypothetical protein
MRSRSAALAFVLVVGLAPTAFAQSRPALDKKYEIGESLGSGLWKHVHTVKDHPDLVIGILHDGKPASTLTDERSILTKLAKKGVPVAQILEVGTYEGEPAYVEKRYVTGSKADDWYTQRWDVLNETTLADVATIRRTLAEARFDIVDPQFLVDAEGHVVVADPLRLITDTQPTIAETVLAGIERDATRAIERRLDPEAAEALLKLPDAKKRELAPYFEKGRLDGSELWSEAKRTKLWSALGDYLAKGKTTDFAKRVAKSIEDGERPVGLRLEQTFPMVAADLVRDASRSLEESSDWLEGEVKAAARALDFLRAKRVPVKALGTADPLQRDGAALASDPSALVTLVAGDRAKDLSPEDRARLEGVARGILGRGSARETATPALGMSELLKERMSEGREADASER